MDDVPAYLNKWTAGQSKLVDSNPRLSTFCFPSAGGGASVFREWKANLPAAVEVHPIQLPGRENRCGEKPFTNLSLLVEVLIHALDPLFNLPFVFFGHSMGALISFEFAQQLQRKTKRNHSICLFPARELLRFLIRQFINPRTKHLFENCNVSMVFLKCFSATTNYEASAADSSGRCDSL